jgi:hypothetical protein
MIYKIDRPHRQLICQLRSEARKQFREQVASVLIHQLWYGISNEVSDQVDVLLIIGNIRSYNKIEGQ